MTTPAPFVPGLPALASRRPGRRRCAPLLTQAWTLTPLLASEPTPALLDFLTLWYLRVRQEGEHAALWGERGFSPSHFVLTYTHVPLLLVHAEARAWTEVEGLMMAAWLDDVVPGIRARLHQWVAPPYRHPHVSLLLGQALLDYLFTQASFLLLEGRTPVGNRLGVRYALRLGFRPVATLPYGEWAWAADGTRSITAVMQTQLTCDDWQQRQQGRTHGLPL
jgi:hypothetical protein